MNFRWVGKKACRNLDSGSIEAGGLVCWVGKDACGLVVSLIMNESLVGRQRSKVFAMLVGHE